MSHELKPSKLSLITILFKNTRCQIYSALPLFRCLDALDRYRAPVDHGTWYIFWKLWLTAFRLWFPKYILQSVPPAYSSSKHFFNLQPPSPIPSQCETCGLHSLPKYWIDGPHEHKVHDEWKCAFVTNMVTEYYETNNIAVAATLHWCFDEDDFDLMDDFDLIRWRLFWFVGWTAQTHLAIGASLYLFIVEWMSSFSLQSENVFGNLDFLKWEILSAKWKCIWIQTFVSLSLNEKPNFV